MCRVVIGGGVMVDSYGETSPPITTRHMVFNGKHITWACILFPPKLGGNGEKCLLKNKLAAVVDF